jgi:hypothetical protein
VRFYCTYFDSGYLTRGLALLESLRAAGEPFRLFVVCMDVECERALRALAPPEVTPIAFADFEAWDPDLAAVRPGRTRLEFFYTCSPLVPLYALEHYPEIDQIVYLDADLYFFTSPAPVFEEIGDASIAIISHRFGPELMHLEKYGRYNVGFLAFRRTDEGLACLRWWRDRTIEWCFAELQEHRFGDQKYLDRWPTMYPALRDIAHAGANVAPWNVKHGAIAERGGRVHFGEVPLVFYHFHGIRKLAPGIFDPQLARYFVSLSPELRTLLYGPYLAALERAEALAEAGAGVRAPRLELPALDREAWRAALREARTAAGAIYRGVRRRELIFFVGGRAF